MQHNRHRSVLRAQRLLLAVSILLMVFKLLAWWLTHSIAVLTDALESLVNVAAGILGYYSLSLSAKPKDSDHPYGHGKAEFLSAAVEGTLIVVAGLWIIYESVLSLFSPHTVHQLDWGILILVFTALVNGLTARYCIRVGKQNDSLALISSGTHLNSDALTSMGLVIGLFLVLWTGINALDSWIALLFAVMIIVSGIRIVRSSVSGIMDEADQELVGTIVSVIRDHRRENWVDVHNLRVVNYAGFFHIDLHMTVPRYFTVDAAHVELDAVTDVLKSHFDGKVEFSIHTDGCIPAQCGICSKADCPVRSEPFYKSLDWTSENVIFNAKHVWKGN